MPTTVDFARGGRRDFFQNRQQGQSPQPQRQRKKPEGGFQPFGSQPDVAAITNLQGSMAGQLPQATVPKELATPLASDVRPLSTMSPPEQQAAIQDSVARLSRLREMNAQLAPLVAQAGAAVFPIDLSGDQVLNGIPVSPGGQPVSPQSGRFLESPGYRQAPAATSTQPTTDELLYADFAGFPRQGDWVQLPDPSYLPGAAQGGVYPAVITWYNPKTGEHSMSPPTGAPLPVQATPVASTPGAPILYNTRYPQVF